MSNNALTALVLAALDDSAVQSLEERVNELAEVGFKPEIVDSLPTEGNDHTLYLVPNDNDGYDEYLYVNNSWEQIGDTNIDFSDYYTKDEIDNMIDDLDGVLKQYGEMPTADAALEGQVVQYIGDTNQYYNNSYFYTCVEDPDNPGEYIWEQVDVQDAGGDLSNYYTKTEVDNLIPTVPTNVSAFTNDAGYLTQHQDLSNYYTKTEVDNLITQHDTMPEATSENVGQIIQYIGDTNEYYTQAYYYICVEEAGSGVPVYHWEQINVQDNADLSDYYTKTEVNNKISIPTITILPAQMTSLTTCQFTAEQRALLDDDKYGIYYMVGHNIGLADGVIYKAKAYTENSVDYIDFASVYEASSIVKSLRGVYNKSTGEGTFSIHEILTTSNTTSYTPSEDYNPATKKYVDEQKIQYTTMPNASSSNVGQVIQYVGSTTPNYTQGHFYICINGGGNYYWQDILVQDTPPSIPTFDVDNGDIEEYVALLGMVEDAPDGFIVTHITGGNIGDAIGTLTIVAENAADFTWYDANGNLKYVTISVEIDPETGDSYVDVSEIVSTPLASKAYVTGAVNAAIAGLDITKREIVNQLPTQDISTKTIYMVPKNPSGTNNAYTEYMYINNAWEKIGDTEIDLSDYVTKEYIENLLPVFNVQDEDPELIAELLERSTDPDTGDTCKITIMYIDEDGNEHLCNLEATAENSGNLYYYLDDGTVITQSFSLEPDPETGDLVIVYGEKETTSLATEEYVNNTKVLLPATVLNLWTTDTSAQIIQKLGGAENAAKILDAIENNIQIIGLDTDASGLYGNIPVFVASVENNGMRYIFMECLIQGSFDKPTYVRKVLIYTNGQWMCGEESENEIAFLSEITKALDTMPQPTSSDVGTIVQYTGVTNEYYTNGYFYQVVEQAGSGVPVYVWEEIKVQDDPDLSQYVTATILNNMELNNLRMNNPCYYIDGISFNTTENPWINPSLDDMHTVIVNKIQTAYNDGHSTFYLIFRNANVDNPIRYFPVFIQLDDTNDTITLTPYKQVASVNSTTAVSYTVSLNYGTWSFVNGVVSHSGEHIGAYLVNNSSFNYLAKNNMIYYLPTNDYNPATKKYVDDTASNTIPGASSLVTVETMPTANASHFGKVLLYAGGESNVYWMPGHMYQCQRWEDEQQNVSYHWVDLGKRDADDYFMPQPSEENYDVIIQYKGQDTNDYKKGYFYRCAAYTDQGTVLYRWEPIAVDNYLKKDNTTSYTPTADYNPTTKKYVDDLIKPVVIWESNDPATYLKAITANISASPAWQLTNLDMTPFKRIKIYTCAGQGTGTTASASTTAAMVLEMSLDPRAAISAYGGNYVGSTISQKPNDNNRLATLTCAVSADKTSFVVLRQTSLYGTAASANNDVNANVFLIEGYYY